MKMQFRPALLTASIFVLGLILYTAAAHSRPHDHLDVKKLAGNWVSVQTAVVPSAGLAFGDQIIPGGVSIASVTLWTFETDGTCSRRGFANIDGTGAELSIPLDACTITLNDDGTGRIDIESPLAPPSVIQFVVINKNEIGATSTDSAVSAFSFKRQTLRGVRCQSRKCGQRAD